MVTSCKKRGPVILVPPGTPVSTLRWLYLRERTRSAGRWHAFDAGADAGGTHKARVSLVAAVSLSLGGAAVDKTAPEMIGTLIAGCIASGIWTAYLMRSKRVKNTYYGDSQPAVGRGAADPDR